MAVSMTVMGQDIQLKSEGLEIDYVNTIVQRSEKNISALELQGATRENVRNIVANRYFELNAIYGDTTKYANKQARQAAIDSKLYRSHFAMEALLSMYLSQEQINVIKDAITYNKVKVTYDAYLDEIPSLKAEEKAQIHAWLLEARDLALDAEGSKQKHEMFNKYKGRINNYLSKRGYDLQKEREAWFKRLEEKKKK